MSTDLPIQLDGWDTVSESLEELRAGHEDADRFFAQWSNQVGTLLSELLREQQRWEAEHKRPEDEAGPWAMILDQLAQTRSELVEAAAGIRRLAEPLQSVARDAPDSQTTQRLQAEIDAMRDERDAMRGDRDAMRGERVLLESELENVRRRVAQLNETLEEQKRTAAEQESYWREEFRRQCALVERLTGQWIQAMSPGMAGQAETRRSYPETPSSTAATSLSRPANESAMGSDAAALESVQAQFELLQDDAMRRRQKNPGSG